MFELIKLVFDISLFKKSPKEIHYSIHLWYLLMIGDCTVSFLGLAMRTTYFNALAAAALSILLINTFARLTLFIANKSTRFYQTSCALLGTDMLISFCALPAIATFTLGQGGLLVLVFMTGIILWQWLVIGHILKAALEQSLLFTLGLSFLYLLSSYLLTGLLFPDIA